MLSLAFPPPSGQQQGEGFHSFWGRGLGCVNQVLACMEQEHGARVFHRNDAIARDCLVLAPLHEREQALV